MRKLEQEIHAIQEESHQPMSDSYTEVSIRDFSIKKKGD